MRSLGRARLNPRLSPFLGVPNEALKNCTLQDRSRSYGQMSDESDHTLRILLSSGNNTETMAETTAAATQLVCSKLRSRSVGLVDEIRSDAPMRRQNPGQFSTKCSPDDGDDARSRQFTTTVSKGRGKSLRGVIHHLVKVHVD